MAAFVIQVYNVVDEVIKTSQCSDRDTNEEIGDELMQMTRAVVKKHTLSPMNAYKYHLAQPSQMLSGSVVHWNTIILRRLRRKPTSSCPWTVECQRHMPLEVFSSFKAASPTEEGGGLLAKNTNHQAA